MMKLVLQLAVRKRLNQIDFFKRNAIETQEAVFQFLIKKGKNTHFGIEHNFSEIKTVEQFKNRVVSRSYEEYSPYINRMIQGEKNVCWPGKVSWMALSAGTSNSNRKYIPITKDALNNGHYRGTKDNVIHLLNKRPQSKLYKGKGLILGGSFPVQHVGAIKAFELSNILIAEAANYENRFRAPTKEIALNSTWEEKINYLLKDSPKQNITSLTGASHWVLRLMYQLIEQNKVDSILELWPNFEAVFLGGVSFAPYGNQFQKLLPSENIVFQESFNASEGFFAIQDEEDKEDLLLILDNEVFYEFIPFEMGEEQSEKAISIGDVEIDKNYAMLISTSAGLWRYHIGDTIRFTSIAPYKIIFTGRTKMYLNAFGEKVIEDDVKKAVSFTCRKQDAQIINFTIASSHIKDKNGGHYDWIIEFIKKPSDVNAFKVDLDLALQEANEQYQIKRSPTGPIQQMQLIVARTGLFEDWLKEKGKHGGQHKIPIMKTDRVMLEELITMNF